jgi:hypothetical protein
MHRAWTKCQSFGRNVARGEVHASLERRRTLRSWHLKAVSELTPGPLARNRLAPRRQTWQVHIASPYDGGPSAAVVHTAFRRLRAIQPVAVANI